MTRFTIAVENAWIIRSVRLDTTRYYEAQNIWNKNPAIATIYRTYEAAQNDLCNLVDSFGRMKGEILDVVPLHGALINLART